MRRNDIVYLTTEDTYYSFYGRIVRIIDDKALWINSKGEIYLSLLTDLAKVEGYQGFWEYGTYADEEGYAVKYYWYKDKETIWDHSVLGDPRPINPKFSRPPRFYFMPTLRKLKQRASHRNGRNAWKTPLDYDNFYNC